MIEQMIPDDPGPHWAKTLDLHMLALLGGRQRSGPQYAVWSRLPPRADAYDGSSCRRAV